MGSMAVQRLWGETIPRAQAALVLGRQLNNHEPCIRAYIHKFHVGMLKPSARQQLQSVRKAVLLSHAMGVTKHSAGHVMGRVSLPAL